MRLLCFGLTSTFLYVGSQTVHTLRCSPSVVDVCYLRDLLLEKFHSGLPTGWKKSWKSLFRPLISVRRGHIEVCATPTGERQIATACAYPPRYEATCSDKQLHRIRISLTLEYFRKKRTPSSICRIRSLMFEMMLEAASHDVQTWPSSPWVNV